MKKIALVLSLIMMLGLASVSVYAEDTVTTTGNTEQSSGNGNGATGAEVSAVITCMQTAVEKRDTAIIAALDTYTTTAKAALTARKDALKAAWAIADRKERRTAIKAAWTTYRTAIKEARSAFRTARKTAWDTFKADSKACKPVKTQDVTNQSVDNSL